MKIKISANKSGFNNNMRIKVLAIFLVSLIISLSYFDSSEYVRCTHIVLCEFLELNAHLENTLKPDILLKDFCRIKDTFFSILENSIFSKELVQSIFIFSGPAILESFMIKYANLNMQDQDTILANNINTSPLIETSIISNNLNLVEISVIRS